MDHTAKPFRIAIVGGGIGGLFAALCIHHQCQSQAVEIDVYEQAAEFKEIGAGVGLGVNAAKLVHKLGLGQKLNDVAGRRNGIWITFRRYDNGEEIVTVPAKDYGEVRQAPVARSDVLDLFRFAIEDRKAATMHTNKKAQRVEEHSDSVTIYFADNTTATANLVVGCDGIHSKIRNQFIQDKPMYSGQIAYRGLVPVSQISDWPLPSYSGMWCAKGKHFLTFPISRNETLNIVAFANAKGQDAEETAESWVSTCDRKEVEEDYKDFEPTVQKLISMMPEKPGKWRINDREPLERWHFLDGKIILLGDSAHAMLPHMGAGAGQSMEDGWVLSRVLGDYFSGKDKKRLESIEQCAAFYQAVRKPRAQKVQAASRNAGATYDMQTEELSQKSFDECVPIVAKNTIDRMKFVWEEDLDAAYDKMSVDASA